MPYNKGEYFYAFGLVPVAAGAGSFLCIIIFISEAEHDVFSKLHHKAADKQPQKKAHNKFTHFYHLTLYMQ